jgi:glycosyltransferase involved in cell wall biosynthesis
MLKVAYFSPLPPEPTGIADYSALLLPALAERVDVCVVPHGTTTPPANTDVCLYHVGNNPEAHAWIVEALRSRPGVVVLHEFVLHHLVAGMTLGRGDGAGYLGAMERGAGVAGRLLAHGVIDGLVAPLWEVRAEDFPLADEVLEHAAKPGAALIVHSRYVAERALDAGYEGRLWTIPHPAWPSPAVASASLAGRPVIGSFGTINASKRLPQLLRAFAQLRCARPGASLHVAGGGDEAAWDELSRGQELDGVVWHGRVDERRLWSLIAASDVCVALRAPTMGETSGVAMRALSLGKPLVVSDVGWFAELPDDVALKVPPDAAECDVLGVALELLASDGEARATMGRAAAQHAAGEHGLARVADLYAAALEAAAAGEPGEQVPAPTPVAAPHAGRRLRTAMRSGGRVVGRKRQRSPALRGVG